MESFTELDKDLKQTDIEFCDLYFKSIKHLLNMDDPKNTNSFSRYLELLRTVANANCEFYENPEQDDALTSLFMENLYYRIAYVYRNSTLYSSAVAFHFQNVLNRNPAVLEELLKKRVIRLCSLGCGPASDVVAVVKLLEAVAKERGVDLDVRVTVVDADLSWKNTCLCVLRCIPMFNKATWKIKFIQADLSQFFTLETVEAIQNADVVTLVKFSSEFVGSYMSCRDTIKEISEIINSGCLLFFLDRPNSAVMSSCGGINGDIQNFCLVYEEVYDFLNLHLAAVKSNFHLYEKYFGANVVNTCFKVFCRAWLRSECGCSLAASTIWPRTERANSSESPLFATECGISLVSPPAWYTSKFGNSMVPQWLISEYGKQFDDSLLPSWMKTECGNCLANPPIALVPGNSLSPLQMKSESRKHLAFPPLTLECDNLLEASSSIRSEIGNLMASSPLTLECGNILEVSSTIKSESGTLLASSSLALECSDSLAASSTIKSESGNLLASSPLRLECCNSLAASSSIRSESGNLLAFPPAHLRSQTENCLKSSAKNRFGNKREKFDVLEFFRLRPYRAWHYFFCLKMKEVGWNWRGMQVYCQSHEEMWDGLYLKLLEQIKMLEDVQEELIVNIQRQSGVISKSIWKQFMLTKRELAFVKRQIYCEIVISLRGYLKSNFPMDKN